MLALLAGATPLVALRLGLAMVALQSAIGVLNDVVDAPRDRGRPDKPLAAGLLGRRAAVVIAVLAAGVGVVLALPSGTATAAVAVAVLGVGLAYDLSLKGTAWSWLPFAVGIPLLPVFAWVGAVGSLPRPFAILLPAAFLAGAALAVGNALADAARDRAAGVDSVALRLGSAAWGVHAGLLALVGVIAGASLAGGAAEEGRIPASLAVVAGAGLVVVGLFALRGRDERRRERGWELEAVGVAVMAVGWVGAVGLAG